MFYCWCFFFVSPQYLRAPWADRHKNLPRDRKVLPDHILGPKIWGPPPPPQKKKLGPKTCKIWVDFGQLQTSIVNISGTDRDTQNRKDVIDSDSSRIRRKMSGELWSTNNTVLQALSDPPKSTFRKTIFRTIGGAAGSNFYTCYRMTKACLLYTSPSPRD